MVTGKNTDRR